MLVIEEKYMQTTNINAENGFVLKVYEIVESIPSGRVMTYGQIAALAGNAGAARIVGSIAHYGPPILPWHRVVKSGGFLAEGFPGGGRKLQRQLLEAEGIKFNSESKIQDFEKVLYLPTDAIMYLSIN